MKIRETNDLSLEDYINLLSEKEYSENNGLGFKDINLEENNIISGVAVKRSPIFVNVFDDETKTFIEREDFIVTEIDFIIDLVHKLIEIYGVTKETKKLITVFSQTIGNLVNLEQINLSPSIILEDFNENSLSCEITKLQIKDFSSEKGVIGTYDIKSLENKLAWILVGQYKNDVVKATIMLDEDTFEAVVQIFHNGKFKIVTKPRNNSKLILEKIKKIISTNLQ